MSTPRKFSPGQRVWRFDPNRLIYPANRNGGPIYEKHYREFRVLGIEGRSYRIVYIGDQPQIAYGRGELVGFAKAERDFVSDKEKDDDVYQQTNKNRLADLVRDADAATLRRVAQALGEQHDHT